jgi:hypothetical protein
MLRQLNRTLSRGRVCGTPYSGTLGSLIPSTGDNGAGYIYASLSLPADNLKEYQGYITSVPSGLTITAYENSSFIAAANDGSYVVPWDLYENGVYLSSTTFTLNFGATTTTITGITGNAAANGSSATISKIISGIVGNSTASGSNASILCNVLVNGLVGNSVAVGNTASISNDVRITAFTGNAVAQGMTAIVASNVLIQAQVGNAQASGNTAGIGLTVIGVIGNSVAAGRTAHIQFGLPYTLSARRKVIVQRNRRA